MADTAQPVPAARAAAAHTPRIFSGVQPTGTLTLGNYLGAVKRFDELQGSGMQTIYCVVDLHAITQWQEPAELARATRMVTASFLACGLDPTRSILFNQSAVPGHAQLGWILSCVVRIGWLNRMTQFKDKAGKNREAASAGLYVYPALMAADILLYKGTHVPVGDDQKQHLELSRDIAAKFNLDYGEPAGQPDFFPLPEPIIEGAVTRVMSLRDGTKKMSKSDPSDMSRINLTDDADTIAQKIRKAKTDPEPLPEHVAGLAERPEAKNLVAIYAALTGRSSAEVLGEFAGQGFGAFKPRLAEVAVEVLAPISAEIARLTADPAEIDRVLAEGAERAGAIAEPILAETERLVGFLPTRRARIG